MTIRDLMEQFEIQGGYCIKEYDYKLDCCIILAEGKDFECEWYDIDDKVLDMRITYMYAVDGVLNIEVE